MIDTNQESSLRDEERPAKPEANEHKEHPASPKVIDLQAYRQKTGDNGIGSAAGGAWERTSQPLFPGKEEMDHAAEALRIVKVSSGFGKLHVPAWNDNVRCMAAA